MVDYSKVQEPCFVCDVEDALGEERGTQSHPICCGWRVNREKEGYEKGLNEIYKLCNTLSDETNFAELNNRIRNTALNALMQRYDIKDSHGGK